jgi:hypothetical protein
MRSPFCSSWDLFYITDLKLNNSKIVQPTLRNNTHGFCLLGPPEWGCNHSATLQAGSAIRGTSPLFRIKRSCRCGGTLPPGFVCNRATLRFFDRREHGSVVSEGGDDVVHSGAVDVLGRVFGLVLSRPLPSAEESGRLRVLSVASAAVRCKVECRVLYVCDFLSYIGFLTRRRIVSK